MAPGRRKYLKYFSLNETKELKYFSDCGVEQIEKKKEKKLQIEIVEWQN